MPKSEITITKYTTLYAPWEEGADDREVIGEDEVVVMIDDDDEYTMHSDGVTLAEYLADIVRDAGTIEPSDSKPTARTWFIDPDGYEHPYTGTLEITSVHVSGSDWTDALAIAVAALVRA